MNTPLNKSIFGFLAPYGQGPKENLTPIGLQTLLLGSAEQPFVQDVDPQGNVRGFLRVQGLRPTQYVALPVPTEPQVGQPHLCALVTSQQEPRSMLVAPWTDMSGHVLEVYPSLRDELVRLYPVAGFRLAGFILGQVPRYAAASQCAADLGSERFEFELNRLRIDDQHYFRISPEVLRLARDSGYDIKPPRDNHPTP